MDNKDLLDLCRLNLIEEKMKDIPSEGQEAEVKTFQKAVVIKQREAMHRVDREMKPASDEVMSRHEYEKDHYMDANGDIVTRDNLIQKSGECEGKVSK